jgi:hypothetical protein
MALQTSRHFIFEMKILMTIDEKYYAKKLLNAPFSISI